MAKRGRKKKNENMKMNVAVIVMILGSIILGILIYMKTGLIGETMSPILGGLIGYIKYFIPIGTFVTAIYIIYQGDKKWGAKIIQLSLILLFISIIMNVHQVNKGGISLNNNEFQDVIVQAYELGTKDVGGGAIAMIVTLPLINMLGTTAAIILSAGLIIVLTILMFGIDVITSTSEIIEASKARKEKNSNATRKRSSIDVSLDDFQGKKETKKERKLREQAEKEQAAMDIEQLKINLNDEKEKAGILNKLGGNKLYKNDIGTEKEQSKTPNQSPEFIEDPLFKTQQEEKEDKTKEVLQLQHTMVVEDENYEFPPMTLLSEGEKKVIKGGKRALTDTASKLQKTLYSFGVSAKVENVSVGPGITRYELKPAEGVRVSKIANLADDIALNLAAKTIRIEAPIPGKQAVGIEVPNEDREVVHIRDIFETETFQNTKCKLPFALGKDVTGVEIVTDIAKMPHVLIAGATGSGKSVCINTLIASLIYKEKPSEAKLMMIDPKIVELSVYNGIPHLLIPVVTDPKKAAGALAWAVQEMENRYSMFAEKGVRDLKGYNEAIQDADGFGKLPHIVIIIDELADLMMVAKNDVEDAICRLAQKARAAGMHLVIATQRPSVDVITGLIKANIPSRIAFAVSSQVDSRTILDQVGAEKLLGKGDMLFFPTGAPKPTRIQGAFIDDKEVEKIVDFLKANGETTYREDITEYIENANTTDKEKALENVENDDETDPLLEDAIETVIESGQASTSFIQRRFKVGYARAGRIIDQMEERGIISGYQGSKPREVLMTKERWQELNS